MDLENLTDEEQSSNILYRTYNQSNKFFQNCDLKMDGATTGIANTLRVIREPIVDYQDSRGVARSEQITFVNLLTSLCTQAYTAAITIFVMLWNLLPLAEGLLIFVRFVLDKLIDILETANPKDRALKAAIFCGEMVVVLLIVFLIMGLIFVPVYVLTSKLFGKVFGMLW